MNTTHGRNLSTRSLVAAATLFGIGVISGVPFTLAEGEPSERHVPGTEARGVFLVLSVLTLLVLLAAGPRVLRAPFTRRAATRLSSTLRDAGLIRRLAVLGLLLINAYDLWRCGVQVIAGLSPDFTANAWGGPSYLGALYCHYLVALIIWTVSALLLHRLLLSASWGTATHPPAASDSAQA